MALWLAARALNAGDWRFAVGSGVFCGLGYLARPEVLLVPTVIALTWLVDRLRPGPRPRPVALVATA